MRPSHEQITEAIGNELVNYSGDCNSTKLVLEVTIDCDIDYDLSPHSLAHQLERMAAELRRVNYMEQGKLCAERGYEVTC